MQTKTVGTSLAVVLLSAALGPAVAVRAAGTVPIVYSTDLFHPHGDPDDHYDLATLFALDEFDIRGIILDVGERQKEQTGRPPVEQMMHITGRKVPYAVGLGRRLRTRTDKVLDEPSRFQGGVELLLSALRQSATRVTIFTVGSCRDVAAAWNRQPDLMTRKVRAVYVNAGNGLQGPQWEHNVGLDEQAYFRLFETGLPLYWCPCWGADRSRPQDVLGTLAYATYFVADQAEVVGACTPAVQSFFVYCLTRSDADPIAMLGSGPHPLPTGDRNMWCTAVFFHAAGREIYQRGPHDFVALPPDRAEAEGVEGRKVTPYEFVPVRARRREPSPAESPQTTPEGLVAAYRGRSDDRVARAGIEPDGEPDCRVHVSGLTPGGKIQNIVLTGPRDGRWELQDTDRWWRVVSQQNGDQLDCWFSFWAAGTHRIEIILEDGSTLSAGFEVPEPATALDVELHSAEANAHIFHVTDKRYPKTLASALKNLLGSLGRNPGETQERNEPHEPTPTGSSGR